MTDSSAPPVRIDQLWMKTPAVQRVFKAIEGAGGQVRFVGGCVRDALLGRAVSDIDLATTLLPGAVITACTAAGCKVIPTGLKYGTVTVVCESQPFEVTTLRRDVATDGRHAEVAYTDDWQEDAARRDFTMNALSCDAEGRVTDFFGGLADLKAGRVRFVGVPEQRISEDVLRILRFFRFSAHFGHAALDGEGLAACRALVNLLPTLSAERVGAELLKLLKAAEPAAIWREMLACGVLQELSLPLTHVERLTQVIGYERALGVIDPLRRLWALLAPAADLADVAERLRLSREQAKRLMALTPLPNIPPDLPGRLRAAYWLGAATVSDGLVVSGAADREILARLENWHRPQFALGGRDMADLGLQPGPQMGTVLAAVERWWVEQNFSPDKEECLVMAKSLMG